MIDQSVVMLVLGIGIGIMISVISILIATMLTNASLQRQEIDRLKRELRERNGRRNQNL